MENANTNVPKMDTNPITLTRFLIQQQQQYKEATGDFTILITALQTACKYIASKVKKAGIANLLGLAGGENTTGDQQKKLDIISNEVCINTLQSCGKVCVMVSEENEKAIFVDVKHQGKYFISFDPLDGSSNIDANVSIGTIFGIWKRKTEEGTPANDSDWLRDGKDILAGGYCVYGSATMFCIAIGGEVNGFTLDPSLGEFMLTHRNIKVPKKGKIYSINEGNCSHWYEPITEYVATKKTQGWSLRYVGSMVADVHRTFLYGGIFIYPADKKAKTGKLRILYECFPMAFMTETAGGKAISGGKRILDLTVTTPHDKSGIILGSADDVEEVFQLFKKYNLDQ